MTQAPTQNVVEVQPTPTVYTVLIIITILAQILAIGFASHRLMSKTPSGYDVSVGQIFDPFEEQKAEVDRQFKSGPRPTRAR
jgi:hypothetical protein